MKTFLHIGCGPKHKDQTTRGFNTVDWHELRLDIDAGVNPDIIGILTDMSAVAGTSVDAIFSNTKRTKAEMRELASSHFPDVAIL